MGMCLLVSLECQLSAITLPTPTPHAVNSLGISEELKEKLRDVMVDRHKVALGKGGNCWHWGQREYLLRHMLLLGQGKGLSRLCEDERLAAGLSRVCAREGCVYGESVCLGVRV